VAAGDQVRRTWPIYTPELMERAFELKERHRLTWRLVAERLGLNPESLKVKASAYRHGRISGETSKRLALRHAIIAAAENGDGVPEIAERHKLPRGMIRDRLRTAGFDAEVRNEYRRAA